MQRVDPFIPVSVHRMPPVRPATVQRLPQPARPTEPPVSGVDGFVRSRPAPAFKPVSARATVTIPAVAAPSAVMAVTPAMTPVSATAGPTATAMPLSPPIQLSRPGTSKRVKRHRLRSAFAAVMFVVATVAVGAVSQTLLAGELLIAGYAVYALIRRVPSRTTFMLAVFSLVLILVLRALGKDELVATNFAVYSLLLALVGVITLAREVRQSKYQPR